MSGLVTLSDGRELDFVSALMQFEADKLSQEDDLFFMSHMVKTGLAWSFQGWYGRQAMHLMDLGLLKQDGDLTDNWQKRLDELLDR